MFSRNLLYGILYFIILCNSLTYCECSNSENCKNLSAHVDLLIWTAHEKSFVLTNETSPVFFTDNFTKADVIHPSFDWKCGYRIGLGYTPPCRPWDITFDWTHFYTTISQKRSTNSNDLTNVNNQQGMFPIWAISPDIISGDYVSEADMKGKIYLNLLDLDFHRCLTCIKCIDIKPYIGLRTAWIEQGAHIHYRGGIFLTNIIEGGVSYDGTDSIYLKNNFWGIGPRIGFDADFFRYKKFSLYGNAAIAGLVGVFTVGQKEIYLDDVRYSRHKHPVRFRWVGDLAAGISWVSPLCRNQYYLTLKAGWEYHIFFDQLELKGDSFHLVSRNRNLDFQGVTLSCLIDF